MHHLYGQMKIIITKTERIQDGIVRLEYVAGEAAELEEEKQFLEKALSCYESDIHKAENTGNEYFVKLVGDMIQGRKDLDTIKTALNKIDNFSD